MTVQNQTKKASYTLKFFQAKPQLFEKWQYDTMERPLFLINWLYRFLQIHWYVLYLGLRIHSKSW